MPWNELSFPYGATLTASDMNALHENFTAICSGSPGAPNFTSNAFPDEIFSDTFLDKSSSGEGSQSIANGADFTFSSAFVYHCAWDANFALQGDLNVNGTWRSSRYSCWFGNSRMRVNNNTGALRTLYYRYW